MNTKTNGEGVRTQIFSSGGGVQSTAICALIVMGELTPDLSIIVDTGREGSATWDYLNRWTLPALDKVGVKLHRVHKNKYATVDLYSRKGDLLVPAFTDQSGDIGKLPTYCSNEWKQRVMRRWATEKGVNQADVWIGFTIDEMRRVKQSLGKWQYRYPLIERRMTRGDCIALVKRIGWPGPPRSACWMCPNMTEEERRHQKENVPNDFELAVKFERYIRTKDDALYLSGEGRTLDKCEFNETTEDMFTGRCGSGMCFV